MKNLEALKVWKCTNYFWTSGKSPLEVSGQNKIINGRKKIINMQARKLKMKNWTETFAESAEKLKIIKVINSRKTKVWAIYQTVETRIQKSQCENVNGKEGQNLKK